MVKASEYTPLVSVTVIVFNSETTVIETLDSVAAQDYNNIELIISDDCSTDNTMDLCRGWAKQHKDRFVRTELLSVTSNTGVAGNMNRAGEACKGKWVKPIAGDDLLLPDCIGNCVHYVSNHPDTVLLFGKIQCFGDSPERCMEVESVFNYDFFSWPTEKQLDTLIFGSNCVPATALFYNAEKTRELGVRYDERIPLLEDWPMWINCLRKGLQFEFMDKVLVKYRLGGISTGFLGMCAYESVQLFRFYYQYPEWERRNRDEAISRIVKEQIDQYKEYLKVVKELNQIRSSKAYRFGKVLLHPFSILRRMLQS